MVLSIACTVQSAGSKYLEVVTSKNSKIRRRITVPWQYHPRRWWRREWFIFLIPKEASVSTNKIPSWKFSNQEMKFFKVDNFLQNHFYAHFSPGTQINVIFSTDFAQSSLSDCPSSTPMTLILCPVSLSCNRYHQSRTLTYWDELQYFWNGGLFSEFTCRESQKVTLYAPETHSSQEFCHWAMECAKTLLLYWVRWAVRSS